MSVITSHWAAKQNIKHPSKGTLQILSGMCDTEHSCSPSHAYLSQATGLSIRTVRRYLEHLREEGYVWWEMQTWRTGKQVRNRYFLMVDSGSDWSQRISENTPEDEVATTLPVELVGHSDHSPKLGQAGTENSVMSDVPGLSEWSQRPPSQAKSLIGSSVVGLRPTTSNMPNLPIRHDVSGKVRKESRRARTEREAREAAETDPVKIAESMIGESLAPGNGDHSDDALISDLSQRSEPKRQRRTPGPDTLAGLIRYWNTNLGLVEWGSALDDTNITLLTRALSRWKKAGATADEIRSMMDMYAKDPGIRTPGAIPWKDFLNKRALLKHRVQKSEKARAAENHRTDEEYWAHTGRTA